MFRKRPRHEAIDKKESMMIETRSGMEMFENLEIARLTAEKAEMKIRHDKELVKISLNHNKEV